MKTKLVILASIVAAALVLSSYQSGSAVQYEPDDEYITKVKVEPYKGKQDLWVYIVKVCAEDKSLRVVEVILKSDMAEIREGVNKSIPKGKCSFYGAVMKAKDGSTLGAELVEDHEARDKISQLKSEIPNLSKQQLKTAIKEYLHYIALLGPI